MGASSQGTPWRVLVRELFLVENLSFKNRDSDSAMTVPCAIEQSLLTGTVPSSKSLWRISPALSGDFSGVANRVDEG